MDSELEPDDIGRRLGEDGLNTILVKAEAYCASEEQRIAFENHAQIVLLKAEIALCMDQEQRLQEELRNAPPPIDREYYRSRKIFAGIVTVILTVAGFFLAALTFAPFRLGRHGYLFCAGIATVVPFLAEELFQDARLKMVVKLLTAVALTAGMACLMLLADVRGHLLAHEVESAPAVVIDDAQPAVQPPVDDFYAETLGSLRLATVLLAFAMELGAGLALRSWMVKPPHDAENWQHLREELGTLHRQMAVAAGHIARLEDEPRIFHARFWRDFYRSWFTSASRNAILKLLIVTVAIMLVPRVHATMSQHLDLVVALDLTRSVDVGGPDGITAFQENVDGVTRLLSQVSAGTRITVIGITDHSFTQPYILLRASVPGDAGYFGDRLSAAHRDMVMAWKQRSAKLEPRFNASDIMGALALAGQVFPERPDADERRVLVIFSDMRNQTRELDLESTKGLAAALRRLGTTRQSSPELRDVQIYALGAGGVRSTSVSFRKLREFWLEYFAESHAALMLFSPLRAVPQLNPK